MTNPVSISTSHEVLGLKPGESSAVTVRLDAVLRDGSLSLGFSDLRGVVTEVVDGPVREVALDRLRGMARGEILRVVATRTQDGIEIDDMAALAAEAMAP